MRRFRLDPANKKGFHLIDVENGGERVYIPFAEIDNVIDMLKSMKEVK